MAISPAKMFKDIAATAARFRAVPAKVATLTAARISQTMTTVAANRGRKRHGWAEAVPNGVLVHAYTFKPHFGLGWMLELKRIASKAMRDAANGKD